jgi:hypothetical protein
MMKPRLAGASSLIVVLTAALIHRPSAAATRMSPQPPIVRIIAREYAFDAPDSIDAGPTTIRLESRGREEHFVQPMRIVGAELRLDSRAEQIVVMPAVRPHRWIRGQVDRLVEDRAAASSPATT